MTGNTLSSDFPTANPFQAANGGGYDAFAAKLTPAGNGLAFSSYFGGSDSDGGYGIGVDASGYVYVMGYTYSANLTTVNPFQASNHGGDEIFAIKIDLVSSLFYPEITVGSGWSTTFAFFNTGSTTTTGELFLTDQQGNPLVVASTSLGTDSSFPISIMPGGTMFLTVDLVNPGDPSKHGWATAEFWEGNLAGVATYQFNSEGTITALAGVLPAQPMQYATVPVNDNAGQQRLTAFAIANPTDQALTVYVCLVDDEGVVVDDTVTIQLQPGEQKAKYFVEYFKSINPWEFSGTAVFRAQDGGTFIAVSLIQNQTLFTVAPVGSGKAPDIPD